MYNILLPKVFEILCNQQDFLTIANVRCVSKHFNQLYEDNTTVRKHIHALTTIHQQLISSRRNTVFRFARKIYGIFLKNIEEEYYIIIYRFDQQTTPIDFETLHKVFLPFNQPLRKKLNITFCELNFTVFSKEKLDFVHII